MKKILIMTSGMYGGGVEKALISMLQFISREEYEITILLFKREGEFLTLLPEDVIIKEINIKGISKETLINRKGIKRVVYENLKGFHFIRAIKALYYRFIANEYFYYLPNKIERLVNSEAELDNIVYDLAICYHIHSPFNLAYISKKINALYKIAWVHNDFKTTGYPVSKLKRYFSTYKQFFVVSEQLKTEFKEIMPSAYKDKVEVFNNIISADLIVQQSNVYEPQEYIDNNSMKILSIGRLTSQKGFDIAIQAATRLKKAGKSFIWYIIGEGADRDLLEGLIRLYNVGDVFKLLGIKINPYPYIKGCDIYVQPSRHEGYGIAVAEARALSKPIICTEFAGSTEQIKNGRTGIIVSTSVDALTDAVMKLMDNSKLRQSFIDNLDKEYLDSFYTNTNINKLLNMIRV